MQLPSGSRGNRASSTRASPQTVWTSQRWPRTSLRTGFSWSRFIRRFKVLKLQITECHGLNCMTVWYWMVCPPATPPQIRNILGHWRGVGQVCKYQGASEPQRHEVTQSQSWRNATWYTLTIVLKHDHPTPSKTSWSPIPKTFHLDSSCDLSNELQHYPTNRQPASPSGCSSAMRLFFWCHIQYANNLIYVRHIQISSSCMFIVHILLSFQKHLVSWVGLFLFLLFRRRKSLLFTRFLGLWE